MPIRRYKGKDGTKGWQVDVCVTKDEQTRRKRRVVYCPKGMADAIERQMREDLYEEMYLGRRSKDSLFKDLIADYLKYSEKTKKSWKDDESRSAHLLDFFGAIPAQAITLEHVARYQHRRAKEKNKHGKVIQPATVNRELALLSAVYNFGNRTGKLVPPHNPCTFIKRLPERNVIQREITDDDLLAICQGREEHVRRAFLIARFTGLRHAAVLALDWSQITEDGIIYPNKEQAASKKKVGRVPIREGLWPAFGERKTKGPIIVYRKKTITRINSAIRLAQKESGIKFRMHDLRASFQTELLRAGVDEIYRKILLGHGRDLAFASTVQERYARVNDQDLIRIVNSLPDCQHIVNSVLNEK
jgi:integrase